MTVFIVTCLVDDMPLVVGVYDNIDDALDAYTEHDQSEEHEFHDINTSIVERKMGTLYESHLQ